MIRFRSMGLVVGLMGLAASATPGSPVGGAQDGRSPESAYVTGRDVGAQYRIISGLNVQRLGRGLVMLRGCAFDVHMVRDTPQSAPRRLYFMLGGQQMDYRGACALEPPGRPEQILSGQGMLPR